MICAVLVESSIIAFNESNQFRFVWKIDFPYQRTVTKDPHDFVFTDFYPFN